MPHRTQTTIWTVEGDQDGYRLERLLAAKLPHLTRGTIRRILARGKMVCVDGRPARKGYRVALGQRVELDSQLLCPLPQPNNDLPLSTLAVTSQLVVIDKPAGVACHPLDPTQTDTVANRLVARFPECRTASHEAREGGIVHRLDRCTSGVLLAARNRDTFLAMRALFARGGVLKHYLALVAGALTTAGATEVPLEPCPRDPRKMRAAGEDRLRALAALTCYAPLMCHDGLTLVHVRCRTGRRHQVRAHLAAIGYPLLGDRLYGGPDPLADGRPFLHAWGVEWTDGRYVAPLPADREAVLRQWNASLWPVPEDPDAVTTPRHPNMLAP